MTMAGAARHACASRCDEPITSTKCATNPRWPPPATRFVPLYLDAMTGTLGVTPRISAAQVAYDAQHGQAVFSLEFADRWN